MNLPSSASIYFSRQPFNAKEECFSISALIFGWLIDWLRWQAISGTYRVPWLFHMLSGWAVAEDVHIALVSSEYEQSLLLWRHHQRFVHKRASAGIYCKCPQQPEDHPYTADWPAQCTHHAPKTHVIVVNCTIMVWNEHHCMVIKFALKESHLWSHVNDFPVQMTCLFLWVGGSRQRPG